MKYQLRVLFFLALCTGLFGCVSYSRYPTEWPKLTAGPEKGCVEVSGQFRNTAFESKDSLADALVKRNSGWRYFHDATHTIIDQSAERISVRVMKSEATLQEAILLLGKDFVCKDGSLQVTGGASVGGGAMAGYDWNNFALNLSEDGSLVLHDRTFTIAEVLLIPIIGYSSSYHRFERFSAK